MIDSNDSPDKKSSTPAERALAEAEARRKARDPAAERLPEDERGGPSEIEPTRYGDWERKGIASDF